MWLVPAIALTVTTASVMLRTSAGHSAKLSENAHEVAYPAGLGPDRVAVAPVSYQAARKPACNPAVKPLGSSRAAYAATVPRHAVVHRSPDAQSAEVARVGHLDVNGQLEVLGITAVRTGSNCLAQWYRVQLSIIPNGTVGWVRAWAVRAYRVRSRIVVDLSERRLRLYRGGRLTLEAPVSVGAPATPTPRGRFFVNERYSLPDAGGPFGPNALGVSAHSDVLRDVWVEDGPIGIHGTNEPWSIGRAASHGCIRVENELMRRLFRLAPSGTPIVIHA